MTQMMPCHHCLKYTNHYAIGRPHEFCSWLVYECNNCEGTKEVDV